MEDLLGRPQVPLDRNSMERLVKGKCVMVTGAGGSIGFVDPDRLLGVGYAMNQMQPGIEADTRGSRLVRAIIDCDY